MITVTRYQQGDVFKSEWREDTPPDIDEVFQKVFAYTIYWDDEIIAIIGYQKIWEGVATINTVASDKVTQCGREFTEEVYKALIMHVAYHNIRKVYCTVDSTNERNKRWLGNLGFTQEYVMREAGPEFQDILGYSQEFQVLSADHLLNEEN